MHSPSARPSPAPQLWATARNRRCNWRVPQSRRWSARGQRRTSNSHCRGPSIWPGRSRLAARAAARNRRHADESRHNSHRPRTRRRTQPRPQGPRRQFLRSTPRAPWARCSSGSPRSPGGRNPRCTPGRARMPGRDCSRLRGCRTIGSRRDRCPCSRPSNFRPHEQCPVAAGTEAVAAMAGSEEGAAVAAAAVAGREVAATEPARPNTHGGRGLPAAPPLWSGSGMRLRSDRWPCKSRPSSTPWRTYWQAQPHLPYPRLQSRPPARWEPRSSDSPRTQAGAIHQCRPSRPETEGCDCSRLRGSRRTEYCTHQHHCSLPNSPTLRG